MFRLMIDWIMFLDLDWRALAMVVMLVYARVKGVSAVESPLTKGTVSLSDLLYDRSDSSWTDISSNFCGGLLRY